MMSNSFFSELCPKRYILDISRLITRGPSCASGRRSRRFLLLLALYLTRSSRHFDSREEGLCIIGTGELRQAGPSLRVSKAHVFWRVARVEVIRLPGSEIRFRIATLSRAVVRLVINAFLATATSIWSHHNRSWKWTLWSQESRSLFSWSCYIFLPKCTLLSCFGFFQV